MKNALLIMLIIISSKVLAQPNQVSNPGFEQYTQCPTSISNIPLAVDWYSFTATTPDYYNCTSINTGIPRNFSGYQYPAQGNGYAGLISFQGGSSDRREYIASEIPPLVPGTLYKVAMSVNLGNISRFATNDLGVFFIKDGPKTLSNTTSVILTPHVTYNHYGIIKDTADWVRIENTFVADSAYTHFVIGSFGSLSAINIDTVNTVGAYAYYNIDSVEIKIMDSLFFTPGKNEFCGGDTLYVPFISTIRKQANNVFTLQLSNASGSFTNPVNIGTASRDTSGTIIAIIPASISTGTGYKMRLLASNYPDTTFETDLLTIGNSIAKPVAGSNSPVCANSSLSLQASTTTTGATYSWTGPAVFSSTFQNPVIYPLSGANSGKYIVTAGLHGCRASDTITVIVDTSKLIVTAAGNGPLCALDTLKLSAITNVQNLSYYWTGPGNFVSNLKEPIHPNAGTAMTGEYVLLAGNNICTTRAIAIVVVKPVPENFNASYNQPICAGQIVNFSASSTSGSVVYSWTGPNSFAYSGATPVIGASSSIHNGNYIATATLNSCSLKDTVTLVVKPLPAKPIAGTDIQLCSGDTLRLSAITTTPGATYSWSGPNSFSALLSDTSVGNTTTAMSGNYIVAVNADGCNNADTVAVLIKQSPSAITTSSNSPVCDGGNLSFTATNSTTGATYAWRGPNSFTATTQNSGVPTATLSANGWYVATVSLNGCSLSDSTYALVNPIPAKPVISYNDPLCLGETLNLTANNTANATYNWTGANSFTAGTQNPIRNNMQYADTGKYSLGITVNGCTSPIAEVHVKINPVPFVVIFTPADTICQGQQALFTAIPNSHGGTPTYQWFINNTLAGTGNTYNTTGLSNNDIIHCEMTEYTKCHNAYIDPSNDITMTVMPWLAPSVTFTANPNRPLQVNEYVTFTATPVNAGVFPTYQWKRNGQNIVGATSAIWSANTLNDNDNITVEVFSSYRCPQPVSSLSTNSIKVKVLTGVNDATLANLLKVYPNPAKNYVIFEIGATYTDDVMLTVTDLVGQRIYQNRLTDKTTWHTTNLPSGVYLYNLSIDGARVQTGRIVIEK